MATWNQEITQWLQPFLERLGHRKRRQMCPLYVAALIGPGERKSMEPMAARLMPDHYDRLHNFISDGVWDAGRLEEELAIQGERMVGGPEAVLVVDDTSFRRRGAAICFCAWKNANCQSLVSVTLASRSAGDGRSEVVSARELDERSRADGEGSRPEGATARSDKAGNRDRRD